MDLDKLLHQSFDSLSIDESRSARILTNLDREMATTEPQSPEIMTVDEVADYLRVTPDVIYDLMGEIPCFELGGRILFRKEALSEWIQKREKQFGRELNDFESTNGLELCL